MVPKYTTFSHLMKVIVIQLPDFNLLSRYFPMDPYGPKRRSQGVPEYQFNHITKVMLVQQ